MKFTPTLALIGVASLAVVGCSAEDIEAYQAEQSGETTGVYHAEDAGVEQKIAAYGR